MLILAGALLGAIIGSFIATLVLRWPAGRGVADGRSTCDGCGVTIGAGRLVPILSFLIQRGRAACCGAPIDRLHPVTEMIAAAIGATSVAVAGAPLGALAGASFGWMLLTLALLDLRHMWLPDRLTGLLAIVGLGFGLAGLWPLLADRLIGGIVGFLAFFAIRHGYRRLRGRDGMGGGDVKLFGAIGLWLGWWLLPFVLLAAALGGLLWALVMLLRGQRLTGSSQLPFGLCLAAAAWAVWIVDTAQARF